MKIHYNILVDRVQHDKNLLILSNSIRICGEMPKEGTSYSPEELTVVDEIISSHDHTRSGVRFIRAVFGDILVIPPTQPAVLSEDELLTWYKNRLKLTNKSWGRYVLNFDRDRLLELAQTEKDREFIGGVGITARDLTDLEYEIPNISHMLLSEKGRVTFLGNGMSPVPALVANRYRSGKVHKPPVIVDIFDYYDLYYDLSSLADTFTENRIAFPLSKKLKRLGTLIENLDSGDLIAVKYYLGSNNAPTEIMETDLAINCIGPNSSTILEQASILAVGGKLITTEYMDAVLPPNFNVQHIPTTNGSRNHLIRRLS